ncbi:hypothetical protein ACFQHW_05195 [Lapidilactobacillus achengensis]|uniref:Uncharacterized protein n=1 Tax=Lapidilactobacillus achengensis TaxID=2486000 RepID=A0ABW1UQ43_9LACO|nr:hypothetical protein [Lapidilactobacillus achengensis]
MIQPVHQDHVLVHQTDCAGVTNLKSVTTNHGRHLLGSSSIDNSWPVGVSAQTTVITLSGWSGEIRGEIAVKLSLAACRLGQGLILRQAAHFADWLKTAPTASSPRISQRKLRTSYFSNELNQSHQLVRCAKKPLDSSRFVRYASCNQSVL